MSFFDDDFYSTKVRNANRWNLGTNKGGWQQKNVILVAALSLMLGVLMTVLLSGNLMSSGDRIVRAANKVKPAVVSVIATANHPTRGTPSNVGMGSGIVFQKRGNQAHIITNNHVIEGAAQIEVVLAGGQRKQARLIGGDLLSDLAVLEVDASGIDHIARLGTSERLKAGQTAIAVGNPLGMGFTPTVTVGVVSLPKRTIPISLSRGGEPDWELDVIQTDAAINQGNSGGALVDLQGRVIGINSLKVADMGVEGLGFAIPIDGAKPIIDSLLKNQKVLRPFMGVTSQSLQSFSGTDVLKLPQDVKAGIIVIEVSGPAKDAGLRGSDVIVELDSVPVASTLDLRRYLYTKKSIGDKIKVTFYRIGKKYTISLTLTEKDE